jgi:hypothetical protein
MGYILRLTEANGYPTTAYILSSMGRQWYQSTVGRLDARHLVPLAGLGASDVDRLTHQPSERPIAYVRVYGHDLPSYEVNLRRPKVCPLCLAEGRPCEAFWDLAQASACPIHRVMLATDCPGCSRPISWSRAKVSQCKCGANLSTAPVQPAPAVLCELMAVMRHQVYRDANLAPYPEALGHLQHLNLRRLCKLIWVLSGVIHQLNGGRRAPKARCHYKALLEDVATALENWPQGFRTFLATTYDGVIEASEELPRFGSIFSWLLVRLIKNDAQDDSPFTFLERELYRYGAQHWTRSAMARDDVAQALIPERVRWGTLSEASEATGLHLLTLKKRIAAGEIATRSIRNSGRRGLVVDMDSIRGQQLTQFPAVSIRDAAPQVGVSIETLKALRASGAFEENYRSIFPGSLTQEDVDAFAAQTQVLQTGVTAKNVPGVATLDEAFRAWTAAPPEKAALIAQLLADPTLVVGKRRGRGVGRLQVREKTISDHFRTARSDQAATVGVLATARRLGCSPAVVTWLKRDGHLQTRRRIGRDMPCLASVDAFDQTYEALARTAARVGVTAKCAYASLVFSALRHIKVTSWQYSTVFIHRSDVPTVEKRLRGLK